MFNLGGPDSLDAVEPFLFNLFSDHDIFKIPFGQKIFAKIIAHRRAPKVKKKYEKIGGKSPINFWTECQRKMLQQELNNEFPNIHVITAMRYWNPSIKHVAKKICHDNYHKIILLPLYPHYSVTTTGSSFNEWDKTFKGDSSRLTYVNDFFDNTIYISAINEKIDDAILGFPKKVQKDIQLVFSAHGTPLNLVKKGDPYNTQIKKTVSLIMAARNFSHDHHVCYQSKVGPVKWLQPFISETIRTLAENNKKQLLIIPVSFVSDHIETLHELNMEYRDMANQLNIENFRVMEGLNDSALFIRALKEIAVKALAG